MNTYKILVNGKILHPFICTGYYMEELYTDIKKNNIPGTIVQVIGNNGVKDFIANCNIRECIWNHKH